MGTLNFGWPQRSPAVSFDGTTLGLIHFWPLSGWQPPEAVRSQSRLQAE